MRLSSASLLLLLHLLLKLVVAKEEEAEEKCFYPDVIWPTMRWSYDMQQFWPEQCLEGMKQSPIDIPRTGELECLIY